MARDVSVILDEILRMIDEIDMLCASRSREEIEAQFMLQMGLHRTIEIISEASRHIPEHLLMRMPEIPWRSIRGMGNVLRHEYHRIADDVIWDVVKHDLPPLKRAVQTMKAELGRA